MGGGHSIHNQDVIRDDTRGGIRRYRLFLSSRIPSIGCSYLWSCVTLLDDSLSQRIYSWNISPKHEQEMNRYILVFHFFTWLLWCGPRAKLIFFKADFGSVLEWANKNCIVGPFANLSDDFMVLCDFLGRARALKAIFSWDIRNNHQHQFHFILYCLNYSFSFFLYFPSPLFLASCLSSLFEWTLVDITSTALVFKCWLFQTSCCKLSDCILAEKLCFFNHGFVIVDSALIKSPPHPSF